MATDTLVGATEAREALTRTLISRWSPLHVAGFEDERQFSITDMESAISEAIKHVQGILQTPGHDLANTLWSNINGGHAGRLSELRTDAQKVIDALEKITGNC